MTRQRAIYLKCLECAGGSAREVTLCHLADCPLWEFRCGYGMNVPRYRERVKAAFSGNGEAIQELRRLGADMPFFLKKHKPGAISTENSPDPTQDTA